MEDKKIVLKWQLTAGFGAFVNDGTAGADALAGLLRRHRIRLDVDGVLGVRFQMGDDVVVAIRCGHVDDRPSVTAASVASVVIGDVLVRRFDIRNDVAEQRAFIVQRHPKIGPLQQQHRLLLRLDGNVQQLFGAGGFVAVGPRRRVHFGQFERRLAAWRATVHQIDNHIVAQFRIEVEH